MANYYPSPDFSAGSLSVTGTGHIGGNFDVATSKFTVAAASGNTAVAGTLAVTGTTGLAAVNVSGDVAVATNKFTVAAASGNTVVAGTLAVTGTSTLAAVNASGDVAVATNKFTVAAATGNTVVAGTVTVAGITTVNGRFDVGADRTIPALSPTAFSADTTDWSPATGVGAGVLRMSGGAADRLLYSLIQGVTKQLLWLVNVGTTNSITLVHDDGATGTAVYRFLCPNSANYVVYKNSAALIWYDATSGRWRVLGVQSVGGVL